MRGSGPSHRAARWSGEMGRGVQRMHVMGQLLTDGSCLNVTQGLIVDPSWRGWFTMGQFLTDGSCLNVTQGLIVDPSRGKEGCAQEGGVRAGRSGARGKGWVQGGGWKWGGGRGAEDGAEEAEVAASDRLAVGCPRGTSDRRPLISHPRPPRAAWPPRDLRPTPSRHTPTTLRLKRTYLSA